MKPQSLQPTQVTPTTAHGDGIPASGETTGNASNDALATFWQPVAHQLKTQLEFFRNDPAAYEAFYGDPDATHVVGSAALTITVFRCGSAEEAKKTRKRLDLDHMGKLTKTGPLSGFSTGEATRYSTKLSELVIPLQIMPDESRAMITAGIFEYEKVRIGTGNWQRRKAQMPFPRDGALLVIDSDECGHWNITSPDELLLILNKLGLDGDCILSPSSSSYIKTPTQEFGLRGMHTFFAVDCGTEIPRIIDILHKRAWLLGFGRILVAENGVMLPRSIVDRAMRSSNQPVFTNGAVIDNVAIEQTRHVTLCSGRQPYVHASRFFDLTQDQEIDYERLIEEAKQKLSPKAKEVESQWLVIRTGHLPEAERTAEMQRLLAEREKTHRDLSAEFMLTHNDGHTFPVKDILSNPEQWHGLSLRDPFEPDYGPGKATIVTKEQKDGRPKILSRAHGLDVVYFLDRRPTTAQSDGSEWGDVDDAITSQPLVDFLNRFAMVGMGLKACVVDLHAGRDEKWPTLMSMAAFKDLFANVTSEEVDRETGKLKQIPVVNLWRKSPLRITYEKGLTFSPSGDQPGYLNIWRGFAVEPIEGSCDLYLQHLRQVVCNNNVEHYDWVLDWMADIVQNPGRKPGTAIVLQSGEGTGKSIASDYLGRIFGAAYAKVSQASHLTGKFNAHRIGKLLINANEATWGGDREGSGVLKDLITENKQTLECKGVDAFEVDDYARIIFTSNDSWCVPASADARRFCVLEVSNARVGDSAYFEALCKEMDEDGPAALLYVLSNRKITRNVRQAPRTDALMWQKLHSATFFVRWIFDLLLNGGQISDTHSFSCYAWGDEVPVEKFEEIYRDHERRANQRYPISKAVLGKELRKVLDLRLDPRVRLSATDTNGRRAYVYRLPTLEIARAGFERYMKQPIDWKDLEGGSEGSS